MNIQPKIEPGSSPTHSNNYLEDKSIHDLVKMLRGTCKSETFDRVELVLESRNMRLREEFHMERLLRLHAESEFRKRGEIIEKGKIIQESYEALLKEVRITGKRETVEVLQKMNNELEVEVKKLKEKYVDGNIEIDVLRRKNGELESEVLELRKLNEKMVEDNNELVVLRAMIGKLEKEVLELRNLKKKWLDDSSAHEVRSKVVLEDDKNDLADLKIKTDELKETMKKNLETISELRKENDKRMFEILLRPSYKKFRGLNGRVSRLENDTNFEENKEEDVRDNEFRNDTVEEAAHHTLGVSSSAQPQGATSGRATLKVKKDIDLIHLHDDDDDDDNVDLYMAQGVHEKKTIYGIEVKNEDPIPSSSLAVQQETKFANAVNTVKRKFSFRDNEISSSSSSDDSSFLDNLTRRSAVLLAKKKKL